MMKIVAIVVLVAVLLVAAIWGYQLITAGEMKFEVPRDFKGLIVLRAGNNGQSPKDWLTVPEDGIVEVTSLKPYKDYYQVKARWSNGDSLVVASMGRDNHLQGVNFWTLPLPGNAKAYYFYVGNFEGLKAEMAEKEKSLYSYP